MQEVIQKENLDINNTTSKKWSKEEIHILKELYPTTDTKEIAGLLNRSENSVKVKASKLDIHKHSYTYDNSYFKIIDSPDKAYWLGFIIADGYVYKHSRGSCLGIELSSKDKPHLEKFARSINTDARIVTRTRKNFVKRGYDTECEMCSIRIYSKEIVDSLEQYGVVQNKTQSLTSIVVPDDYFWDYVRGYFDGDGSFSITPRITSSGRLINYGRIGFVCHNKGFLEDLKTRFESYGLSCSLLKDRNNWVIQMRNVTSVENFLSYIYQDENCLKLDRKYEKYLHFISIARNTGDGIDVSDEKTGRLNYNVAS